MPPRSTGNFHLFQTARSESLYGFPAHHSLLPVECFIATEHRLFTRCPYLSTLIGPQSSQFRDGEWARPAHTCLRSTRTSNSLSFPQKQPRPAISAYSPDAASSFTSINMAEDFHGLMEALERHQPVWPEPRLRRVSFWWRRTKYMRRIDEVISIPNVNGQYGESHKVEEADADGRWTSFVAEFHDRRQSIARAGTLDQIGNSGEQGARDQQNQPARNDGFGNSHDVAQADAATAATSGWNSSLFLQPVARLFRPRSRPNNSQNTQAGPSNVADRNKENRGGPLSFADTMDSSAIESDSSDDDDMGTNTDTERERISKLFEDFPTCIQKTRHAHSVDSEEYGIMTISNPGSGWSHIDRAILPPRIAKYLEGFTHQHAAAFPDSVYPDLAINGADSHRWLLATARKEFICDTSTLDVWYRSLADAQQTASPQQPL